MSKIIEFGPEGREKLVKGIDTLADAVVSTLGPNGRNVVIEKEHGQVQSTKDGVTVAKHMSLKDPIENLGDDETYFIDDEKLNIINSDELIDDFAIVVSAETGLLNAPDKQSNFIICDTLMNPNIKCGSQVQLISQVISLNDLYRVDTIEYKGDNFGNDWSMSLHMRKSTGFKVIK